MKIVYIADARSTISQSWIRYFIERGHDVHVISSYPCSSDAIPGASISEIPVAFSGFSRVGHNGKVASAASHSAITRALATLRVGPLSALPLTLRFWLGPIELHRYVHRVRDLIVRLAPDIVHAMRIPFEGILAAKATPASFRLAVSVWGNDLTLCASGNPLIGLQTRQVLRRIDGLLCDCRRDLDLAASDWGFDLKKPSTVLPSAGGVKVAKFHSEESFSSLRKRFNIRDDAPVVINPRGFRNYVCNDIFFQSIPIVLKQCPRTVFICSGMQANPIAEKWVSRMSIAENVRLLPVVEHEQMAELFGLAQISVSPSLHDGTPNSLLEAMSCGCFPVAGDIESVREWITDGRNGLLCAPTDPQSIAEAIIRALKDHSLRSKASEYNLRLIRERASYSDVMPKAEEFYDRLVHRSRTSSKV